MLSLKKLASSAILALPLWAFTGPGLADAYKWQDAAGVIHYTQHPPADIAADKIQVIRGSGSNETGSTTTSPKAKLGQLEQQQSEADKQTALQQKKEEVEKNRLEQCKKVAANLKTLQTETRVSMKEGDKYTMMSEEQRKSSIAELQKKYDTFCK
jgi:hypothetical protein